MSRVRKASGRIAEDHPSYGRKRTASTAGATVIMEGSVLDQVEDQMESLHRKAVSISSALHAAKVPHAVVGGLAVAAHIKSRNPAAVRTTRDMDLLLRQEDFERVEAALKPMGYRYRKVLGISIFHRKGESFEEAIHVVKAGLKVRPEYLHPAPELKAQDYERRLDGFVCLGLADLLVMKLTSFRLKDQVHVQDMLRIGLIKKKIESALPADLRKRLEHVKEETKREGLG